MRLGKPEMSNSFVAPVLLIFMALPLFSVSIRTIIYTLVNVCHFDNTAIAVYEKFRILLTGLQHQLGESHHSNWLS